MATIIIENVPENIVKLYGTKIIYSKNIFNLPQKNIEDMTLLEYINSDEYKNEEAVYMTPEEFLSDLQKYKNKK